ncbi:MAG: hypothetical protein ACHQAX_04805 [Gammaproteobacteria bacterium]
MQHLLSYYFSFMIGELILGFTTQGEIMGPLRWPIFILTALMAVGGAVGYYKTEKARYYGLAMFACLPFLPLGLVPAFFFQKWVDSLAQCDERIRAKVLQEMATTKMV